MMVTTAFLLLCSILAVWIVNIDAWSFPAGARSEGSENFRVTAVQVPSHPDSVGRRQLLSTLVVSLGAVVSLPRQSARAEDLAEAIQAIQFREFTDPLFSIRLPKNYFTIRRSAKGDLPDDKTGQGRRGSTILSAGDMQKAELIAIERYPVRLLLEENGIDASGKLDTFPDLGESPAVANLISLHRERDRPGGGSNTALVPDSLALSPDGKDLSFQLRTEIEVQKPELLMEEYGVDRLMRITAAKATLRSGDGNLLVAFGSALESDFRGPDGPAIVEAVNSLTAKDPSAAS